MKLVTLFALLALTACERAPQVITLASPEAPAEAAPNPMQLKTYKVPEAHLDRTHQALRKLLAPTKESIMGQVRIGPGGSLMVLTTEALHGGIERFIQEIEEAPVVQDLDDRNIHGRYWFVIGRPGEGEDDAALAPIASTLQGIERAQGVPMTFSLMEHIQIQSGAGGSTAEAEGRRVQVVQSVFNTPNGALRGRIKLHVSQTPGEVQTEINIRPGQDLVLGQAGYGEFRRHGRPDEAALQPTDEVLLYVTRFDVLD